MSIKKFSERSHEIPPKASVVLASNLEEEVFSEEFKGDVIKRFFSYVRPYKKQIIPALIAVIIFTITSISIPLIIKNVFDSSLSSENNNINLLYLFVAGFFIAVIFNFISNYLQEILVGKVAEHVLFDMRTAMYEHLQRVSLSFMDKTESGKLMSRLQGDVAALQEFLHTAVFAIGDFVLIIGIVITMLWLDFRLGLLTMIVIPALLLIRIIWIPFARKAFLRARITSSIVSGALAENINGVRAVQGMTREYVNYDLFDLRAKENLRAALKASKIGVIMLPTVDTLSGIARGIVVIVGGIFVLNGQIETGVMVAFVLFIQRFFDPIRALTMHYNVLQRAMASGERIFEVIDVPVDMSDKEDSIIMDDLEPSIEFDKVTFGYLPDQTVLKNINFKIKPGETVALVGPTGSGKTSTTALVHRFYEIWDGEIRIGGVNISDIKLESLGTNVSMVLQEPFLFSGSIFDNIVYSTKNISFEKVVDAAKAVGVHNYIMELPDKYETQLEQRGENLSIGQRQLISFARALVRDSKIIILDEATANIDSYTEMQIQNALKVLLQGRTAMVIAHRLATIRDADKIIVLQNGEIIEQDTHDNLMKNKGLYYSLSSLNYSSFDDIPQDLIQKITNESSGT
ncbi:MAG: ABC transporter ATP-binding protein [SAR202 cluster bacterium]|nr:ABC transporter ATP-binding protein [SAR202 cluster bacterium]